MKHLRIALACLLGLACLELGAPRSAFARDDDEDGDNVLESDEVSDDDDEAEEDDEDADDEAVADTDPSAVVIYRSRLAPYGTWMDHPRYGTVWVPSSSVVGADFAPYVSAGRWELTDDGDWLWVSDYDWGYVPFHYGRWVWVSGVGWAWIPGRVYAPAWVTWRVGPGGYVGWAPMPPAWYWVDGVAVSFWVIPPAAFVFCPTRHVFHRHVHTHVVHDRDEVRRAASSTSNYSPARPQRAHKPASPTMKDAGIAPGDAPKARGKHDPRALELAKQPGKSSAKSAAKSKQGFTESDKGRARVGGPDATTRKQRTPSGGARDGELRADRPDREASGLERPDGKVREGKAREGKAREGKVRTREPQPASRPPKSSFPERPVERGPAPERRDRAPSVDRPSSPDRSPSIDRGPSRPSPSSPSVSRPPTRRTAPPSGGSRVRPPSRSLRRR